MHQPKGVESHGSQILGITLTPKTFDLELQNLV